MSDKNPLTSLTAALGATFAVSLLVTPVANAAGNPFTMNELDNGGYMVSEAEEGKCGEGKCGEGMGEGMGGDTTADEGSDEDKGDEGKCGEGKCGEGKCGG
jgi:uncharacterized low-complexity protein